MYTCGFVAYKNATQPTCRPVCGRSSESVDLLSIMPPTHPIYL